MISVVIPAYNAENFIGETLESILAQTAQSFEIIVVDDGSTDRTVQIVRDYIASDSRIQLILNDHGRQSKARNTAIAAAKYPWIAPIDADDIILPTRFEEQLKAAKKHPEVVAWGTYSQLTTVDGEPYRVRKDQPTSLKAFEELRSRGDLILMPNSSVLLRKDIVEKIGGYDSRFDSLEDVEILLRMADHGPVIVLPKILMHYRMHYASTTGAFESFRWQRKLFKYLEQRNQLNREGQELSLDDFLTNFDDVLPWQRLWRYMDDLSAFQLKMAALYYGQKRHVDLLRAMLASLILNPYYVLHRLINRFILKREFTNYRV